MKFLETTLYVPEIMRMNSQNKGFRENDSLVHPK